MGRVLGRNADEIVKGKSPNITISHRIAWLEFPIGFEQDMCIHKDTVDLVEELCSCSRWCKSYGMKIHQNCGPNKIPPQEGWETWLQNVKGKFFSLADIPFILTFQWMVGPWKSAFAGLFQNVVRQAIFQLLFHDFLPQRPIHPFIIHKLENWWSREGKPLSRK